MPTCDRDGKYGAIALAGNLMFPTIARIGPDGAVYVANFSVGADNGEGQILRIDANAAP